MARSKNSRINRLRAARRKALRQLKRALDRGASLKVIHRLRGRAQADLAAIRKQRELDRHPHPPVDKNGVTHFDGVPVAKWLVPYLQWARDHGWQGRLVSGYRDPAYSESLCRRMCGRPSCPGRCAGRASNHSGSSKPHGAIDVSAYWQFASVIRRCPYQPHIFNALPRTDPVHFSASGR